MKRGPLALLAFSAFVVTSCGRASDVRQPTQRERTLLAASVTDVWDYESRPPDNVNHHYGLGLRRPPLHPHIARVRISRSDSRYASAVVELRDRSGRRRGAPHVMLLERMRDPFGARYHDVAAGPSVDFANACTAATPRAIRDVLCPDPWPILGYPRPRVRAQLTLVQRIESPDLHAVDWTKIALPGGVCGSSRPIKPVRYRTWTGAFVHPDVDLAWWNPVVVSSWWRPRFGDLDGDGDDEAALEVVCANGGGTASGQLAFSAVVFRAVRKTLRVLAILTPRQPLDAATSHVPLLSVRAMRRGAIVTSEAWYGPHDSTCCSSGRAQTVWRYLGGKLVPARTSIVRPVWTSTLHVEDVVAEPADQSLMYADNLVLAATQRLHFDVGILNMGDEARRGVKVTLRIRQRRLPPIVRTKTIDTIEPWDPDGNVVSFHDIAPLEAGVGTVEVEIDDAGARPLFYPVRFSAPGAR